MIIKGYWEDGIYILNTVKFTEDDWNTEYKGSNYEESFYCYLIKSHEYGTFWIPKNYVKNI